MNSKRIVVFFGNVWRKKREIQKKMYLYKSTTLTTYKVLLFMVIVITSILVSFIYVLYQLEIRAIPAIHLDSLLETSSERERESNGFFLRL